MLTDVEIYNCAQLTRLPMEMLAALPNIQSLNISMNKGISGEQLKADWEALIDGESGDAIQILYMGYNNLRETPSHDYLKRMTKLGYLDCTNNRLEIVHPFGKEISFTTIYLDNNRITRLYAAEDGYFCGLSQMETLSCANNCLTELPDIFTAQSIYTVQSVNFSSNNISKLENGDNWRGINSSSLNLADNCFEELPARLMKSGSKIETLMLSSNGMRKIAEGALTGPYSYYLTTVDLSFNRLKEIPFDDFSALNMPYLYGIDLSSNAFEAFPYAPLGINTLTVMSIRQQRDDAGNRTLREWPTGLYTCPKMSAFYIGSNDLRKIEDTISPYILLFEIKDNPNISIDLSGVCAYIEMGYYELIYDSTQDIRGCDALNLD
jgi:Leucine-rich repeat (LRR) protein